MSPTASCLVLTLSLGAAPSASDPTLTGAGDIASCESSGDERTARLLDDIPGTIFTVGDNAYRSEDVEHPLAQCRDRVNLVKHMLEGMGARTVAAQGYLEGNFFHTRIPNFERGQLATFGDDKWLAPYPDTHEMLANILQGKRAQIILALDTTDAEQRQWWQEARALFKEYAIRFEDMSTKPGDQARIKQIVSRLLAVPGPAAVIVPFTPKVGGKPRPGSETSDQIVWEFTSRTHRSIVWTTNSEYVPRQPTERGNTEMPPPIGG